MEENIKPKKQMEVQHLTLQFKTYRQTYYNRPLLTKNIETYLQHAKFIAQLAPTILVHYFDILSKEEIGLVATQFEIFVQDILTKLKNTVEKLQKREANDTIKKSSTQICRVCLHELRSIELEATKQQLQNKTELSKNILRLIRGIEEQGEPFTSDEDCRFFHELKLALQKKEEVLQICNTQSLQFAKLVEQQLKELLATKQLFMYESHSKEISESRKGEDLKQQVSRSLADHLNSKIPVIIQIVKKSFKRGQERQKKMNYRHVEVQTMDTQSSRINEMKGKISRIDAELQNVKQDRMKLQWKLHEKEILNSKLQRQLNVLKQQLDKISYEMQKNVKGLEQKNRKFKEEIDKQKSRRQLFDKQSDTNNKTIKTILHLKQGQYQQDQHFPEKQNSQSDEDYQRKSKKKRTLHATKGSAKFFLPTLTKISKEDNQLLTKTQLESQPSQTQGLAKTGYISTLKQNGIKDSSIMENVENEGLKKQMSKTEMKKKSKKQLKKLLSLAQQKRAKQNNSPQQLRKKQKMQSKQSNVKTDRFKQSQQLNKEQTQIARLTHKASGQFPLIKNKALKSPEPRERIKYIETIHQPQNSERQKGQLRNSIKEVSQKLNMNKIVRSSFRSSNSSSSIFLDNNMDNAINNIQRDSIYRNIHKKESINQQDSNKHVGHQQTSNRSKDIKKIKTSTDQRNISQRSTHKKAYNINSYSQITEEIDKQNFMTPNAGIQSPTLFKQRISKRLSKQIEDHLQRFVIQLHRNSRELSSINYQQLRSILTKCINSQHTVHSSLISDKSPSKQSKMIANLPHIDISQNVFIQQKTTKKKAFELNYLKRHKNQFHKQKLVFNQTADQQQIRTYNQKLQINQFQKNGDLRDSFKQPTKQLTDNMRKLQKIAARQHSSEIIKNFQHHNSIKKKILTQANQPLQILKFGVSLFINEENAYKYQTSFSKKNPQKMVPLNAQIEKYTKDLFDKLEQLKYLNIENYQQVCSYLRYPFTSSQKGCLQIDIIHTISYSSLIQCFQRINILHGNCRTEGGQCVHLTDFKKKIQNFIQKYI